MAVVQAIYHFYSSRVDRISITATGFPAAINIENRREIKVFLQGLNDSITGGDPAKSYRESKYEFSLIRGSKEEKYLFNDHLSFYQPGTNRQFLASPRLKDVLLRVIKELEQANPYGEFLKWEEVRQLFPRYAYATVIDAESGRRFKVQRRAGSRHADVQPLTADDTAVMKEIFGGKWTWRRRAIIVEVNGRRIAASMNGKPHGAGAIPGNNFRGHFCIHFRGSKTHGSRQEDLAHQIMVWKSAGKTEEMLRRAGPEQTMWVFFTAVEQQEYLLAARLLDRPLTAEKIQAVFDDVSWLNVALIKPDKEEPVPEESRDNYSDRVDLPVKITWQDKKTGRHDNVPATITLIKSGEVFPWLVSRDALAPF
jgi:hypothetical protein